MTVDEFVGLIDASEAPRPSIAAVAAFEAQYGLTLPEDYRAFLAAIPGGWVQGSVHFSLVGEEDGSETLANVYGLQVEGDSSLVERLLHAEADAVPQGLLPVMSDCGGNTLALVLRPDRFGEMVFLDHEVANQGRATLEDAVDWGYAFPFARSFTAMVTGFKLAND